MNPLDLSARELGAFVRRGQLSAEEVVQAAISRMTERETLNAVVHRADETALAHARALDSRRLAGEDVGPLAGVPLAVKDNISTLGMPTTCGSRILADYRAPFAATAVERLVQAGAIIVAKTNCDEFGMGSSTENSCYGPTKNPHDPARVPGGSSGGSAVVVADRQVPLALGSETGGSVRQPAAFCGIVGLKPTYGRVSRWGLVAYGSSLDQIGPFSRDVRDAALTLSLMAGPDGRDATAAEVPTPDLNALAETGISGKKVGLLEHFSLTPGVAPEIRAAVQSAAAALIDAGAEVVPVDLPLAEYGIPIYYLIATSEASSNLARFEGVRYGARVPGRWDLRAFYERNRGAGLGREVKRRIMLGTFALSAGYYEAYYGQAQRARAALIEQFDLLFQDVDLLLLPTTPTPAFLLGEKINDPLEMYLGDIFTVLANLGGLPAVSLPAPRSATALPVGIQLMGPRFGEGQLLAGALALEERGFQAL